MHSRFPCRALSRAFRRINRVPTNWYRSDDRFRDEVHWPCFGITPLPPPRICVILELDFHYVPALRSGRCS
jgi:hypothetical protein